MRLPTLNIPLDNTSISTYMTCPREYNLRIRQGWTPKKKSQALAFGVFVHHLLEAHYNTGGDQVAILDTFQRQAPKVPDDTGDYRTAQRALLDYKKYIKKYPPSLECDETVGFPDSPMVELQTAMISEKYGFEYEGKIDRIITRQGSSYVQDHKTTSRLDKQYFQQYHLSNQMKGYVWLARRLAPNLNIVGVEINLWHVLTSKTEFHRYPVMFSDSIIDEWEDNTQRWLERIAYSTKHEDFPAHFGDNGCKKIYGLCQFFDVCKSSPVIREGSLDQDFIVDHWDPLKVAENAYNPKIEEGTDDR